MNMIALSKHLSWYLRHAPIKLLPGGWYPISTLLIDLNNSGFKATIAHLKECVETDNKKRYSFDETGTLIRANQGHSNQVDLLLEPIEPPEVLYHGTATRFMESIMEHGLRKGERHHVHLSESAPTAEIVGARHGVPVVLVVESKIMHADGHKFYLSANGVWLVDSVPPKYLGVEDDV
jgi:putative RNA 2'-phosphotransferase